MSIRTFAISSAVAMIAFGASATDRGESLSISVDCPKTVYVGQAVPYSLELFSTSPNIGRFNVLKSPSFGDLKIYRGSVSSVGSRKKHDGKEQNCWNVALDFIVPDTPGSFTISGGDYVASIGKEVVVDDFFWGSYRSMEYDQKRISAPDHRLKVKELPKAPADFSGAVGHFKVECWLPPGKVSKDIKAVAVVKISGEGILSDSMAPDLMRKFGDSCRLLSVSPSSQMIQRDGKLCSELILECEFTPNSNSGSIPPIGFTYFDTEKGKYITSESDAVHWDSDIVPSRSDSNPPESFEI